MTKKPAYTEAVALHELFEQQAQQLKSTLTNLEAAYASAAVEAKQPNPLQHEPSLFADEADYERVAASVIRRIEQGEIQPCEPDEAD